MKSYSFKKNGKEVIVEFRPDCALVLFVEFDAKFVKLADSLEEDCFEVECVTRVSRTNDNTGQIVVRLKHGYSPTNVIADLDFVLNNFIN